MQEHTLYSVMENEVYSVKLLLRIELLKPSLKLNSIREDIPTKITNEFGCAPKRKKFQSHTIYTH